jgi:hypothetical protein
MNPGLSDPHNHVPEVSPDDAWDDGECFRAGATVLPPKRVRSAESERQNADEGLRIESNIRRVQPDGETAGLVVQEIDGSVVRLDPDAMESPERVPRQMSGFQERPAAPETDPAVRNESKWGLGKTHSLRWIVGTGLGVATVIVIALVMLPSINQSNAARPDQAVGLVIDPKEQVREFDALNAMVGRQPEAEKLFGSYANATIAEDVLPLVRDAKSVEPLIRSSHRPVDAPRGWRPQSGLSWVTAGEGLKLFGVLEGLLPDFSPFRAYMVVSGSALLIDWKATTAYSTATFAELLEGTGNPAEIRAFIAPSGFYSATFPEAEYRSFQLVSADGRDAVWCYTRRGDAADGQIAGIFREGEILEASREPTRVTLRLARGPDGAAPNQWLIAEMLHKDWLMP